MYSVWIVNWNRDNKRFERWFNSYHIAKDFARNKPGATLFEKDVS